jgi:hypothetical protein
MMFGDEGEIASRGGGIIAIGGGWSVRAQFYSLLPNSPKFKEEISFQRAGQSSDSMGGLLEHTGTVKRVSHSSQDTLNYMGE